MTEAGWITLATALFGMISSCFTLWVAAKYGNAAKAIQKLDEKTDTVIGQNHQQAIKIEDVSQGVNGRLQELIDRAVEAAFNRGKLEGINSQIDKTLQEAKEKKGR